MTKSESGTRDVSDYNRGPIEFIQTATRKTSGVGGE